MQNQKPSEGDITKKSLSSPADDTLHPTNNNPQGENLAMKTARQVLEELAGSGNDSDGGSSDSPPMAVVESDGIPVHDSDNDNDKGGNYIGDGATVAVAVAVTVGGRGGNDGGGDGKGSIGGGGSVAVAVAVSGVGGGVGGGGPVSVSVAVDGGSVVVESVVLNEGVQGRKRKTSVLRDPPPGKPTCPLCLKEFSTWKGAFGHMRAHPDRDYRGFFGPPVFGSSSSSQEQPPPSTDVDKGDDTGAGSSHGEKESATEAASPSIIVRVPMFDLNEPNPGEEEMCLGFDLNEMPPAED